MEDRMGSARGGRVRAGALACIAAVVALAAVGCGGSTVTPETIYLTPPPGPVTPLPSGVTPAPSVGLPTPVIDSVVVSSNAPDNHWTVTFKKPVVSGIADAALTKMNDAIAAQVNDLIGAFTKQNLPAVAPGQAPSTLEGDFSIALDSPTLVSLRFTVLTYVAGAANPVGQPASINFVVSSGATVNLTDLLTDPTTALSTFATQAHAALASTLGADLTWSGSAPSMSFFDKAWAMTPGGLEFTWAQGDLASQAAGMPTATLPWAGLKSIIKPTSPAGEFVK
jgi:hypothetical protein